MIFNELKNLGELLAALPLILMHTVKSRRLDDHGWKSIMTRIGIGIAITLIPMFIVAVGSAYVAIKVTPHEIVSIKNDMDNLALHVKELSDTTIRAIDKLDNKIIQIEMRTYEHQRDHNRRQQ